MRTKKMHFFNVLSQSGFRLRGVLDRFDAFGYELAFTTLKAARVTARSEIQ
jgi:hypothetical protein